MTAGIWSRVLKSIYSSNGSLYIARNNPYGFLTISCDLRILKIKKDILYTMEEARSVKEMSRAGPKKGAQNQPCQPRSFQGMSEKEEKFKQNQVQ